MEFSKMKPRFKIQITTQYTSIYMIERNYVRNINFDMVYLFMPWIAPWEHVYFLGDPDAQFEFIGLPDKQIMINKTTLEKIIKPFPVSKSQDGQFTLGWSHKVLLIDTENFEKLPGHQLAVEVDESTPGAVVVVDR